MKIGIDARFLTHPQAGGFKTYTENLIIALAKVDQENEYILYLDRPMQPDTKLPTQANFSSHVVPGSMSALGMPWREQLGLTRRVAQDKPDLFHAPCLTAPLYLGCPLVMTIHDMIWLFPERFRQGKSLSFQRKMMEWYNRLIPRLAARKAAVILTVSQAARESIIHHLGVSGNRVLVTYEAPSPQYRPIHDRVQIESVRQVRQLPSEFILAIGSADPRKNISTLVQAYALLPDNLRERFNLGIVWTHTFLTAELFAQVEQLGLSNQVYFLKQVSNEELVLLYNAATLFVFPSLYEGFGLPPLEAMACGIPVVAANNSSIPEIAGEAALYFQAEDAESMAGIMANTLMDESLRSELIKKGCHHVATFSWEKCAQQTLESYKYSVSF
ncbi:MAG TPA: glycosyltransferase family 1 protein [Chloroflexota bacterium]|nr:glycosyltransferase family 1 protein [Chloroflexota bacterium]HUM67660.1 glycosyltransferase family 1 protein [Chloroflexota bacterium]